METRTIDGLTLFFDPQERAAAEIIGQACERSTAAIQELWALQPPADCRVYVMTSWLSFVFQSAPWSWRLPLALTLPLWAMRVRRTWWLAGGWAQRYGHRQAVGVKTPRLLQAAHSSMGERVFLPVEDPDQKVQHVTCHELTHAFTAHLKLPAWLNEGLAMVTVDRLVGHPTVRENTLDLLRTRSPGARPNAYRRLNLADPEGLIYLYVRGYWITRYLVETRQALLRDLLGEFPGRQVLEERLAAEFERSPEQFWQEIDGIVLKHFGGQGA